DEAALRYLARLGQDSGDWKLALAACERLLKLDLDDDSRLDYLHQIGRIYSEGLGDRVRAERAYRTALDQLPTSDRALSALIGFYEQAGDTRSMRVHLDRCIGAMRIRLAENVRDGVAYRVIARALEARERVGVRGSLASARCAAELALTAGFVGEGEDSLTTLAEQAAVAIPNVSGLEGEEVDEMLFPPAVSLHVRQLFAMLGDRVAKHVGIDLRRYGVGRGERLRRREDPVVAAAHEVAALMGVDQVALYVTSKEPILVACEPTSPVSIILGHELATADRLVEVRFAVGRALKLIRSSLALPARMSDDDFGVFIVALLRLFDEEFAVAGVDAGAVAGQLQRLRRLVPAGLAQQLAPYARGVMGERFDHRAVRAAIHCAGDRAGLLTCGSMRASLRVVSGMRGFSDLGESLDDPRVAELVRFAVSKEHTVLRGMLDRE
ncbi:MAG: hypothetical protein AAGC55_24830, partial [Myxococcota bacterium]